MCEDDSMSSGLALVIVLAALAQGQSVDSPRLLHALREGGNVVVMRHAHAPAALPDASTADPGNSARERQLDQQGKNEMAAMGNALRELRIPVGEVQSSPTFRALQTAQYAGWKNIRTMEALGDGGQSMQGATLEQAAYLRKEAARPTPGTNRILISHSPNLQRAFPEWTKGITEGEALILRPSASGKLELLGRVPVTEWPKFEK